jgi:peptide/nickel transport system permease protein
VVVLGVIAGAGLLSFLWTPQDVFALDLGRRLLPPSVLHPFGTDQLGRDVLSLIMAGARTSLAVALAAVLLGAGIGLPLGIAAAARGGWFDELLSRGNDVVFAFPSLLLAVLLAAALGPGAVNACLAIGVFNMPVFARLARSTASVEWRRDYVRAARLSGLGTTRISLEHIWPNIRGQIVVQVAIQLSLALIAEAGLAYVGLGTQPPAPNWGRMLADAQTLFGLAPWLAWFPGIVLVASVLSLNLIGEGLRRMFDQRASSVA